MKNHMANVRTTLVLDQQQLVELKRLAAEQGRTLSSVVEETLRLGIQQRRQAGAQAAKEPIEPPDFDMGVPRVPLAPRDRLHDLMNEG